MVKRVFRCSDKCCKEFISDIKNHICKCLKKLEYKCNICNKWFNNNDYYEHKKTENNSLTTNVQIKPTYKETTKSNQFIEKCMKVKEWIEKNIQFLLPLETQKKN